MAQVANLNNRAAAQLEQGDLDGAGRTLNQVQALLDARPPATPALNRLEPAFDEYFYRCHRVALAWARGQAPSALADALRADELERGIDSATRDGGRPRRDFAFSTGAWSAISVLTSAKRFDEAALRFDEVLADRALFEARLSRDRASAEQLLVAGLCVFFEAGTAAWTPRAAPFVARAQGLVPRPDNPNLAWGYACLLAGLGQTGQSLDALARALELGVPARQAIEDADLAPLLGNRRFRRLVGLQPLSERIDEDEPGLGAEWRIDSTPPGASLLIDGAPTGWTTPVRLEPRASGRHTLELRLDGYAPVTHEHHQSGGAGLSLSLSLRPLAEVEAEREAQRRADEDASRPPDAARRERTRAFLGGDWRGARIRFERHTTYGLGGLTIDVGADGRVALEKQSFGGADKAAKKSARLPPAEVQRLFERFVEEAFTELVMANRPGVPDEIYSTLELSGRAGTRRFGRFASDRHARFEALAALVLEVVLRAVSPRDARALGLR